MENNSISFEFKNFVGVYHEIFSKEECQKTIDVFEKYDKSGLTSTRDKAHNLLDLNYRRDTSLNLYDVLETIELDSDIGFIRTFVERFYGFIYPLYVNKYPILQELPKHRCKGIKIQKTMPTEGYHMWHCEHHPYLEAKDRILSWILYLNDVEEGGETEFLYQSLRFKPKAGTFILFPAYFTHPHRGNPPLSNEKYIATGWVEYLATTELQGSMPLPNLKNYSLDQDLKKI